MFAEYRNGILGIRLVEGGCGDEPREVRARGSKTYAYTNTGNLSQVTGGGTTEMYTYATPGQADEVTSYAETGKSPHSYCCGDEGTRTVKRTAGLTGTATESGRLPTIIGTNPVSTSDCLAGTVDTHSAR
jgi:hypothetical protein